MSATNPATGQTIQGGQASRNQWHELAQQLRVDSIRCTTAAGSGHPTSSMSAADLLAVLLAGYLRYDFANPKTPNNDHLIFSKGHASPLLYSVYKAAGAITDDELLTLRKRGSRLEGHPTPVLPWVDVATGSLGQGLPIGVGVGLAGKYLDKLPYHIWVVLGDSEMAEGSIWEAMELGAHYKLNNLIGILDMNRLGQRGETMLGWNGDAYAARAKAFGWHAIEIDGHDLDEIDHAYDEATRGTDAPTLIIARTIKGKGFSEIENKNGWHGKALPQDMADRAIQELGGERNLVVQVHKPENLQPAERPAPQPVQLPKYEKGSSVATRTAYGDALKALGAARLRHRRGGRRGEQLDLRRDLRQRLPRPLLRAVHRRGADGCVGGGLAGARLCAVRLDLRRVLHPRVRLHPHGRHLAGQHPPRRLARGRLDRRGWPLADGAGGSGDDARGLRQHGALSERREPDGAARRGDGRARRASASCGRRARRRR